VTLLITSIPVFSQANYNVTDPERSFKEAKDFFMQEQYALAYPLLKELKQKYPENTVSSHTYLNQDIEYYFIVCGLALNHKVAEEDAAKFIKVSNNEPRQQRMSYHLAKYYFIKKDFEHAISYYERAGYNNLSNEEIADAKFELAYSYFNLKRFEDAKPLFNEIHQLPNNKYYYPANYYYGFISYRDRDYAEALKAFKLIENQEEYVGLVPYYIAEIYYFQGKKDEALQYGEEVLKRGNLVYQKELNLLTGQIYFEKRNFAKALPLLEVYVNTSDKVTKEILYELSYSYYEGNQVEKAIEGFKQLSNEKDSLGQNSMYLLGDLYIRTNQKENARNAFQYSADNSSNRKQQEISRFNYAKLSYELGYQDIALSSMKTFADLYPGSVYANEAKEILVRLLANTNNFNDAISLYESFESPTVAMQKIYPKILFGKATELINDQRLNQADEILTKLLRDPYVGNVLPYANFWKGEIAYRQGRYDETIKYVMAYLQSSAPSQGEATPASAKYLMGYSYIKKENYAQALNYFQQVAANVSTRSSSMEQDAYVRTADSYFMNRDYNKAKSMYENVIINALPQSDYALFQQAMIAGIKTSAEKIRILNAVSRQYPSSDLIPDVTMEIANTYMADEKFKDAIPYLNNILSLPGASRLKPQSYLKLGLAYYNLNSNAEALKYYQQLISLYPQSAEVDEALDNIKNIYVEEGKPNEYVDLLKRSGISINVSEADSLTYASGELKYNNKDCANAITAFDNYLSRYPEGSYALEAYYFRSECYVKSKDYKNAVIGYAAVVNKGNSKYAEVSALNAARLSYFELQDYPGAKIYFTRLREIAITQENQLEALRGLVRSYYQTKDFAQANIAATELLTKKGLSTDDKSVAYLVLGKSLQANNQCEQAITAFRSAAAINKSAWGAEARYEIANCYYTLNNLVAGEKAAMEVIKVTGSYDYWVAKAYILLGDIYMQQKDYFNAKATYQSVAQNASIPEIKIQAQQKLDKAVAEEKLNSKIQN
ncbi:MAG: tetratricopeptide repeat protein, partial [Chitinophagaceae bacterium]|nr:tetratricopeptide repeat protein [Chitinophagaceae bacterium]